MKGFAAILLLAAAPAVSKPLVMRMGESWTFRIENGDPADARKVAADAKPGRGWIKANVRAMLGTTLFITNNSPTAYTFRAELIGPDGKAQAARSCTLPADNKLTLESWPQKAAAIRIGAFRTAASGRC